MTTAGGLDWGQARNEHLAGKECLWQDLDGLHCGPAPTDPPLTSWVWGWSHADGEYHLVRLRIDRDPHGDRVFTSTHTCTSGGAPLTGYPAGDQRVAGFRGADQTPTLPDLQIHAVQERPSDPRAVPIVYLHRGV